MCQQLGNVAAVSGTTTDTNLSAARIHVNSDLVVIPVTVTDGKGRVVSGLRKENFTLFDDKLEREITQFASEDTPVTIGLVFDTSASMNTKLRKARETVAVLLHTANPGDEFFLVQFNGRARLLVNTTNERAEIGKQLAKMKAAGSTALLDAVSAALSEMVNAHNTRKAIIVISDGEDNASHYSVSELKTAVRKANVMIYTIGITENDTYSETGLALLNEIAEDTGGCLFKVDRIKQLPDLASKINAWLRNQYVLAFTPTRTEKDGRYHQIEVGITKPNSFPSLHAIWRLGYYAPVE